MWAIANNFNDILIKQFQKALDLTRMQSGLVQTAFYFGYFTMALPAGLIMRRIGYKNGILFGLVLYALGAILFFPAADVRSFGFSGGALRDCCRLDVSRNGGKPLHRHHGGPGPLSRSNRPTVQK